ncbi:hypothetical protein Ac2012v2_005110 [Leucoagaricus gongylophorus]
MLKAQFASLGKFGLRPAIVSSCGLIPTKLNRAPYTTWESLRTFFTMTNTDDLWTVDDEYSWTSGSRQSLSDFLSKYKPSMVQDDGTKPWIWVQGSDPLEEREANEDGAQEEAEVLLMEITARVKAIQDDPLIPARSNKKKGTRSKKELCEEVQAEAIDKLKKIAIKHGYVAGKWLIFAPPEKVDVIWSSIANSLVSGPLSTTPAWLAKVATSPNYELHNFRHLICVYIPDVYDRNTVLEVMKILLRNHGVNLAGVKADLYTVIGIYSKHPSGIPSTVWKNTALLQDAEIKALRGEFYANIRQKETVTGTPAGDKDAGTTIEQGEVDTPKVECKLKPKPRKKAQDDFFASDEDQGRN